MATAVPGALLIPIPDSGSGGDRIEISLGRSRGSRCLACHSSIRGAAEGRTRYAAGATDGGKEGAKREEPEAGLGRPRGIGRAADRDTAVGRTWSEWHWRTRWRERSRTPANFASAHACSIDPHKKCTQSSRGARRQSSEGRAGAHRQPSAMGDTPRSFLDRRATHGWNAQPEPEPQPSDASPGKLAPLDALSTSLLTYMYQITMAYSYWFNERHNGARARVCVCARARPCVCVRVSAVADLPPKTAYCFSAQTMRCTTCSFERTRLAASTPSSAGLRNA